MRLDLGGNHNSLMSQTNELLASGQGHDAAMQNVIYQMGLADNPQAQALTVSTNGIGGLSPELGQPSVQPPSVGGQIPVPDLGVQQ